MEQVELKEVKVENKLVRVEHRYSKENDRWVYMAFDQFEKLVGLNYCQGDDYDSFKEFWAQNDPNLMSYYRDTIVTLKKHLKPTDEFEIINLILWLSWDARNYNRKY